MKSKAGKIQVLYCTSRYLGYRVLQWLISRSPEFVIAGVCLSESNAPITCNDIIRDLLRINHIPEITWENIGDLEYDIGLSVNYDRIISQEFLERADKGFWNIHHSYNMRLRGRNITTHAILTARQTGIYYHGTSLHKMVPELDAGPIVASKATAIYDYDTAYTLFSRVEDMAYQLIDEWIPRICFETVYTYEAPKEGIMMFRNKDIGSREILESYDHNKIYDIIRAFDFPGFEPAYQRVCSPCVPSEATIGSALLGSCSRFIDWGGGWYV